MKTMKTSRRQLLLGAGATVMAQWPRSLSAGAAALQPIAPEGWATGRLERMWWAQGEGGQRLFVIPALQLVVAIAAGNYGREDQGIPPAIVLRELILGSVV